MKCEIDNCYYELVKDLLLSLDSIIKDVKKEKEGVIVTLQEGYTQADLIAIIHQGPLYVFCEKSQIHRI